MPARPDACRVGTVRVEWGADVRAWSHGWLDYLAMTSFALITGAKTTLTIDGVNVTDQMIGVEVVAGTDQAAVVVHLTPAGQIEGDGVVTVVREPTQQEMGERLADWIAELDAAILDTEVRARVASSNASHTETLLTMLAEGARA